MIYCSNCGLANRDGARYCNECGMRLGVSLPCPSCGESNLSTSHFCNCCGIRLTAEPQTGSAAPSGLAASTEIITEAGEDIADTVAPEDSIVSGAPQEDQVAIEASELEVVSHSLPAIVDGNDLLEPEILVDKGHDDSEPSDLDQLVNQASEEVEEPIDQQADADGSADGASDAPGLVDDLLPSWLLESDQSTANPVEAMATAMPMQGVAVAEAQPEPTQAWEPDATQSFPWERPDGIAVARSVARGYSRVRFQEQDEPDTNGSTQFLAALSTTWQPFSTEASTVPAEKARRARPGLLRRILVYLLIAALVALVALLVSFPDVAARIGSFLLDPVGAFFLDVGAFLYGLVAQRQA